MNTLRISPSAYIDSLTLPELHVELVLAAARLLGTRVVPSSWPGFTICRECAARGHEGNPLLHTEDCPAGMVAHLLLAIAYAEAERVSSTPSPRKELSQENRRSESIGTAAEEKRPFLLPAAPLLPSQYHEPWAVSSDDEALDAEGHVMVDPEGCSLPEVGAALVMRRIVACVNHCMGVPTDELCRETERAAAGGGM